MLLSLAKKCILSRVVIPSLSVVRSIKEDEEVKRRRCRKVLYEGFNGSME